MENYNGRKVVEEGDLCERRNGRGVDPNRNWAVDWGVEDKEYNPKEEEHGKAPFRLLEGWCNKTDCRRARTVILHIWTLLIRVLQQTPWILVFCD